MIYLTDWIQEEFNLDTIIKYIGYGFLSLLIIDFLYRLILALIKRR